MASFASLGEVFKPIITVYTSAEAEVFIYKNKMDFSQIVTPFSRLPDTFSFRGGNGSTVKCHGLSLEFVDSKAVQPINIDINDLHSLWNHSLITLTEDNVKDEYKIYASHLFNLTKQNEHEFINRSIGNPIGEFRRLNSEYEHSLSSSSKWFMSHSLVRFAIMLHDNSDDRLTYPTEIKIRALEEIIRRQSGSVFCSHICINSNTSEGLGHEQNEFCEVLIQDVMGKSLLAAIEQHNHFADNASNESLVLLDKKCAVVRIF
ncbi:hypothetical protein ACOME3_000068 [Neoechinorhynchus agilis]